MAYFLLDFWGSQFIPLGYQTVVPTRRRSLGSQVSVKKFRCLWVRNLEVLSSQLTTNSQPTLSTSTETRNFMLHLPRRNIHCTYNLMLKVGHVKIFPPPWGKIVYFMTKICTLRSLHRTNIFLHIFCLTELIFSPFLSIWKPCSDRSNTRIFRPNAET